MNSQYFISKRNLIYSQKSPLKNYNISLNKSCKNTHKIYLDENKTSFPEQVIFFYMKKIFNSTKNRIIINQKEADVYIEELNLAIEYDGLYYHKDKLDQDIEKNLKFKDINFIRIREKGLPLINQYNCENYVIEKNNYLNLDKMITYLIDYIFTHFNIKKTAIDKMQTITVNVSADENKILDNYITSQKELSLEKINPQIAKEWHPSKNGKLKPINVYANSSKKVWWQCKEGHEWKTSVFHRNNGTGCPYCSNRKILIGYNDLQTLNSSLAKQWHPVKNGKLRPYDVGIGSHKKIWWLCENNHEWPATVTHRNNGTGCPYCSNQQILIGYNDLATLNPSLAKQWHPSKNGKNKPSDVGCNSNKKVWWLCNEGHEWPATIVNRSKGKGCPYCSNQKILAGYNDLLTLNPDLAKQWHPSKNRKLTPSQVAPNTNKKVWWLCNEGHEWEASVSSRNAGNGCPYCSNQKILSGYNDLKTINPSLAKEWHPSKNGKLTPSQVAPNTNKKVWWLCNEGHEWEASVSNRIVGKGCPYCSNKKVLKGYNDLCTTHPHLVRYWNYEKNKKISPQEITFGSGKIIWWKCHVCNKEWPSRVFSLSSKKTICCNDKEQVK